MYEEDFIGGKLKLDDMTYEQTIICKQFNICMTCSCLSANEK